MQRIIAGALDAIAARGVKLAAKVAPQREVDIFPHRMHADSRRWWHLDAYRCQPGWVFIEVGGWTVEFAWKTSAEMVAA